MVTEKYVWARIRGLPLNLWSKQSLESIVSMVRTLVEIDKWTLEMEELEYARVLIKLPAAREARWARMHHPPSHMTQHRPQHAALPRLLCLSEMVVWWWRKPLRNMEATQHTYWWFVGP